MAVGPKSPDATKDEDDPLIIDDEKLWSDVVPLPQADTERPMVQIAYHPDYRKAMNLFRAIVKQEEFSERALQLTTCILHMNWAHYTVWNYRFRILKHFHTTNPKGKHIIEELKMLNKLMAAMRKSYQAWQHRALIVELLGDVSAEIDFLNEVVKADPKNYHTWTYRQSFLCKYNRPDLWAGELACTEALLADDIRNNSVWNHRFFLVFDTTPFHNPQITPEEMKILFEREIKFTKQQILKVPNNPSAWNYLRGVLERGSIQLSSVQDFVIPLTKTAQQLDAENSWPADLNRHSNLPAVAAVELLADIYSESLSKANDSLKLYDLLAQKLDPIRKGYWEYRSRSTTARHGDLTVDVTL